MTGTPDPAREGEGEGGFGAFFRRYTRTWQHALATAALTAFGTLTFVHRLFAVLAILTYVLPPVVLYLRESSQEGIGTAEDGRGRETTGSHRAGSEERESEPADGSRVDESAGTAEVADEEDDRAGPERPWETATTPVEETLLDAAVDGGDAYAVGSEGAVLTDRDEDGNEWVLVVPDGPGAGSNALRGVAAADGGVWFAGDGGALGRLDPGTGRHIDYSGPDGDTTDVTDVAAAAEGSAETVLLVDGSGRVRRGQYREGEVTWEEPTKPGSGSSLAGVVLVDGSRGYACDTNQQVFETTDGGRSFEAMGPDDVGGTLTDVAATAEGCAVGDDDGVVNRRDAATWTPERLGEDPLWALDLDGERGIAGGDAGTVYELVASGARWEQASTPTMASLRGVALDSTRALAVGDDGTVLERTVEGGAGDEAE